MLKNIHKTEQERNKVTRIYVDSWVKRKHNFCKRSSAGKINYYCELDFRLRWLIASARQVFLDVLAKPL